MSSVFGMNNVEFSDDSWAVKDEFAFMCKSKYVAYFYTIASFVTRCALVKLKSYTKNRAGEQKTVWDLISRIDERHSE